MRKATVLFVVICLALLAAWVVQPSRAIGAHESKKVCKTVTKKVHGKKKKVKVCHMVKAKPKSTPAPSPTPTTMYGTTWKDGTAGWVAGGTGTWKVVNGALQYDGVGDGTFIAPYQSGQSNYFVEANIQRLKVRDYNAGATAEVDIFGIAFRAPGAFDPNTDSDPPGNSLGAGVVHVSDSHTETLSQIAVVSVVEDADIYKGETDFSPGTAAHLYRVEVRGNAITVSIDGHLAVNQPDINRFFSATRIGLYSTGDQIRVTSFRAGPLP